MEQLYEIATILRVEVKDLLIPIEKIPIEQSNDATK